VSEDGSEIFDGDGSENLEGDEGREASDPASPGTGAPEGSKDSKRINDLMSKWQKAEARAKQAEAALKVSGAASGGQPAAGAEGAAKPAEVPAELRRWIDAAKVGERDRLFKTDPRFETYGVDRFVIEGDTPEQMGETVGRLSALIDKIETVVRNDTLATHGLTPAAGGGGADKGPNFATMSDKEFETFLAKNGGRRGLV